MDEINVLDYINAFGSIATPILVLFVTAIGWKLKTEINRRFELEDKLREDRIKIYNDILEPFIILLTSDAAWKTDPKNKNRDKNDVATKIMLSVEYRQKSFRLSLIGSDPVVKSFNDMFQYFYSRASRQLPMNSGKIDQDVREMVLYLGKFLLEIRRSMGNETTKLNEWDMLEWFISDARKYKGS